MRSLLSQSTQSSQLAGSIRRIQRILNWHKIAEYQIKAARRWKRAWHDLQAVRELGIRDSPNPLRADVFRNSWQAKPHHAPMPWYFSSVFRNE